MKTVPTLAAAKQWANSELEATPYLEKVYQALLDAYRVGYMAGHKDAVKHAIKAVKKGRKQGSK
jgi:hypothetical protein